MTSLMDEAGPLAGIMGLPGLADGTGVGSMEPERRWKPRRDAPSGSTPAGRTRDERPWPPARPADRGQPPAPALGRAGSLRPGSPPGWQLSRAAPRAGRRRSHRASEDGV